MVEGAVLGVGDGVVSGVRVRVGVQALEQLLTDLILGKGIRMSDGKVILVILIVLLEGTIAPVFSGVGCSLLTNECIVWSVKYE